MQQFITGFWGFFFGTASLMLVGSVFAFTRSLYRVGFNAALSATVSAFFVLAFLGGLPIDDADTLVRVLASVASGVSTVLMYLFFSLLGLLRQLKIRRRAITVLAALTAAVIAAGWLLSPLQALALSMAQTGLLGVVALVFSVRSALLGERLAWATLVGVSSMLASYMGLGWIALDRAKVPGPVHVASAMAGTVYMTAMALLLWSRYAHLIELYQVMKYGPSYDPVTRMRSHAETGQMVGAAFRHYRDAPAPLGVIVVSIANMHVLEQLYGLAAVNHALFVCAARLRRVVPAQVEMGRLAGDSFLLLVRNCKDSCGLIQLARTVQARLSRPVALNAHFDTNTRAEVDGLGPRQIRWAAEVGAGVLRASKADARAATAVAMARGISRTAWSYPSRVAWLDEKSGDIVGLPVADSR